MLYLKEVIVTAIFFGISCHSFSIGDIQCPSSKRKRSNTRLHLFDLLQKQESKGINGKKNSASSRRRVPDIEISFMESGYGLVEGDDTHHDRVQPPPFPYSIELNTLNSQADGLIIRHLEDEDITKILPELVREFGALVSIISPTPTTNDELEDELQKQQKELADKIENYLFSLTVLIGLTQRVVRRQKGYDERNAACPDHNVIALVERIPINNNVNGELSYNEQIVGIAELSYQPPNPNANAPPFVLPFFMKELIARYGPNREEGTTSSGETAKEPRGYVSNVLVWHSRRGRGYGRVLMAAVEGIAKLWGCEDVSLHVDANEISGKIARGLYWSLGYEGVPDRGTSKSNNVGYNWMDPSMMSNQGLYLVDGVPLLFLRKNLKG